MNSDQVQVKAPGWPWFYFIFIRELKTSKGKRRQVACKPGSVPACLAAIQAMTIHLGCLLPDTSCDTPGWQPENRPGCKQPSIPIWSCSRWGLPCRSRYRQRGALLPHPFTLTTQYSSEDEQCGRFAFCGTFPGVTPAGHYPAPCFRGARTFLDPPK